MRKTFVYFCSVRSQIIQQLAKKSFLYQPLSDDIVNVEIAIYLPLYLENCIFCASSWMKSKSSAYTYLSLLLGPKHPFSLMQPIYNTEGQSIISDSESHQTMEI